MTEYEYHKAQESGEEMWSRQCEEFRDGMDNHVTNLIEYFNILCLRYDVDRNTLKELLLEDIKEQL